MKLITHSILTIVLGTMFLSLFHMAVGMNMHAGMSDCPFMSHEEVICPMDVADHLNAWKSVFLAIAPSVILLFSLAGAALLFVTKAPHLTRKILLSTTIVLKTFADQIALFITRAWQELFSNGVLNPKVH